MKTDKNILVIGAGSIGERHIRNLWQCGYQNIFVYRQRNLPFRNIGDAKVKLLFNWNEVLQENIYAAIISTPTAQHLQQVYDCIKAGIHVLVEKPLSHQLFNQQQLISAVEENNVLLQVGYMLHYHPLLKKVKNTIEQKTYGNLISIQSYWGEYLPAWHPWEDYRNSYAAKKEQGGGVALTLSHDIDLVNWLANATIEKYQSLNNFASSLEVDTAHAFDVNILYSNKATAHVHVNFCQKVPQRFYKIVLEDAVIDVDYFNTSMQISTLNNTANEKIDSFDRNDLFIAQLEDFFTRIESGNYKIYSQQQIVQSYNIIKICTDE